MSLLSVPPPSIPASAALASPVTPSAAPIALVEVGQPIRIDPHAHGIETEAATLGRVAQQVIDKSGINPPMSLSDATGRTLEIKRSATPVPMLNRDGSPVRDKDGNPKTEPAYEYKTWEHNGKLYTAIPIVCSIELEKDGVKQTVEFEQIFYTDIEAPIDPQSDLERENFKNKLQITLSKTREDLPIGRIQTDADVEGPTTIDVHFHAEEIHISTSGFTQQANEAHFGKHKRTRESFSRLDEFHVMGEYVPYSTIDEIDSRGYQENIKKTMPGHRHELPKEYRTLPVVCGGSVDPRALSLEAAQRKKDDFRKACVDHHTTPNPATEALIRSSVTSLASQVTPPPASPQDRLLQTEVGHALDTIEELTESMLGTFESAQVNESAQKTEFTLNSTTVQGSAKLPIHDTLQEYDRLSTELHIREEIQPALSEFQVNDTALKTAEHDLQQTTEALESKPQEKIDKQAELEQTQKELAEKKQERDELGVPTDPDPNSEKRAALTDEIQALTKKTTQLTQEIATLSTTITELSERKPVQQKKIKELKEAKAALEAKHHTTQADLEAKIKPSLGFIGPTGKFDLEAMKKKINEHSRALTDRLNVLKEKYAEVQKARTICRTIETLYPKTPLDNETKALKDSLRDALTRCKFEEMPKAIQALEEMAATRPILPKRVGGVTLSEAWQAPTAPAYP